MARSVRGKLARGRPPSPQPTCAVPAWSVKACQRGTKMTTLQTPEFSARSATGGAADVDRLRAAAELDVARYEVLRDIVDECIDLSLNYRQSGHPGGSRSKVHLLLALLLSGGMRWDIRRPWLRFGDRFVLSAGHTAPLVYSTLAVLNEGLRARHEQAGDPRCAFPDDGRWALTWESLLELRHRGGLPGHPEMAGRTLFLKFNTGPSGHGMAPAAGEALALKLAGVEQVKVFVVEGEGGLTAGGSHETKNIAWGLGLSNLVFLIDWNDFGIDPRAASSVVHGSPVDWFAPYGWRVTGTEHGAEWSSVTRAVLESACGDNPDRAPSVAWFKSRKGRGYGKYDHKSHGTPWPKNSEQFWVVRKAFMSRYGVEYVGVDEPAPSDPSAEQAQAEANLRAAMGVLRGDEALVDWLSERLLSIADSVPSHIDGFRLDGRAGTPCSDSLLFDFKNYPEQMWKKPGEKAANRAALGAWGSYVNAVAKRSYGRPLFIAASADLAESTNISGFAEDFGDLPGFGWYERDGNPTGALLPTEITEFANAGLLTGLASVNLAGDPFARIRRVLGCVLDLRSLLLSQVRTDAALQPARPGLRAEGRQAPVDRGSLGSRDRRRLPHPFRDLRNRRDSAVPRGPGPGPAPLGVQRGAGRPWSCVRHRRADRRVAPHPSRYRQFPTVPCSGSRPTSLQLVARTSCVPSTMARRRQEPFTYEARCPRKTSCRFCRSSIG